MDTIEKNVAPEGGEGATSSQDTATEVNAQTATNEQPASDGTQKEAEQGLLAGKYKSPQELEKAYSNLESKLGELGQKAKLADLFYEKYGVTPDQLQTQIETQEQEAQRQRYADNPLAPIVDEVAQLKQIVQQQEAEKALMNEEKELDKFLAENSAYKPYRDKILKLGLTSEQNKSYEEIATEWFGEARAQGQQDAYKKIEQKRNTQSSGVQSSSQKKFTLDDMRNMSSAELEKILPHAEAR